jgi:virulence-associated protein VagC
MTRVAKIFTNGRSRAVRLPKDWVGDAREVEMVREEDRIVIRPTRTTLGGFSRKFAKDPVHLQRLEQGKTQPPTLKD